MDEKGLMLKVYDIDYSFIIKNYLNEKLWEKEWTIFIYKTFVITLSLSSIDVRNKKIFFEVKITDNGQEFSNIYGKRSMKEFSYNLSIENINILKKTLNLTIFELIQKIELEFYIQKTDRYFELTEMRDTEQQKLQEIAEDFLDDEGVTNDEIREAYIEYYIDKNEKVWDLRNQYESQMRYNMLTELYFIFLKVTNDNERYKLVESYVSESRLNEVLEEIKEYEEYMETEEFQEEMESYLEEI